LAAQLIRRSGIGSELASYVLPELVDLLSAWDAAASGGSKIGPLSEMSGLGPSKAAQETWSAYVAARKPEEVAELVDRHLERNDPPPAILPQLVELVRLALERRRRFARV